MSHELLIRYLAELKWPIVIVLMLLAYRRPLGTLLTSLTLGSKVKISLFGVEVETTLQELENVSIATLGGTMDANQKELLTQLRKTGPITYTPVFRRIKGVGLDLSEMLAWSKLNLKE